MTIDARFRFARDGFSLDASFSIPAQGVTALFGPSGCGKTTLLRLIAGLEQDPNGVLSVAGASWQQGGTSVPTHRRELGYVFQEASLFDHLSVSGNLGYGFQRVAPGDRRVTLEKAIEWLGLADLLSRRPANLSGGERQRVAIARTLVTSPKLLLMDEPLAALDAASKAEIIPYLDRVCQELDVPMIYVSHSMDEVARLADHIVLMEAGRIVDSGPLIETLCRLDSPLSKVADAESVIEARVESHDDEYHLSRLAIDGGHFTVARTDFPVGHRVRLRVMARDVSLTLARSESTSILNILPGTVAEIRQDGPGQSTVRLALGTDGGVSLLCRITRKSAVALGIAIGAQLFAQVKSVALLGSFDRGGD